MIVTGKSRTWFKDAPYCIRDSGGGREAVRTPCGNVVKAVLTKGTYAFFIYGPDGVTPRSIAVLGVLT